MVMRQNGFVLPRGRLVTKDHRITKDRLIGIGLGRYVIPTGVMESSIAIVVKYAATSGY